jgi:cardiolipin-specific phospholipase
MMLFSTASHIAVLMEKMRSAETGLIEMARRFGERNNIYSFNMETFDTQIPASVLPFKKETCWSPFGTTAEESKEELSMHAIRVTKERRDTTRRQSLPQSESQYPLVIIHGYMNGALYFYRNLLGLASFFDSVISVDLLGWGLSSRPSLSRLKDNSVATAEAFFVESLESWRAANNIEKMNLAGHSMGGYLAAAYSEKYPERIDQLLLLSPAGIPEKTPEDTERRSHHPLHWKMVWGLWDAGYTPGSLMRTLPESKGRSMVEGYVQNRLPEIEDPKEQLLLADYMYTNSILPGSGEFALRMILSPGAYAKDPLLYRIPELKVKQVSFLYGVYDWMEYKGGLGVQSICKEKQSNGTAAPNVDVFRVPNAGHLLMLENYKAFNAGVMVAAGRDPYTIPDTSDLPLLARPPRPKRVYNYRTGNADEQEPQGIQVH